MSKLDVENHIASVLCGKEESLLCQECYHVKKSFVCQNSNKCRVSEKTKEQLDYVISPIDKNIFLEACPGSGKTEVVGMKAAYEINKWNKKNLGGIAVLTFTNEATKVIRKRIDEFSNNHNLYPHYIGTVSSFVHQYIAQPFGYKIMKYESKTEDYSFRVIDKKINSKVNPWLNNFKCQIGYARENASNLDIYAHQVFLDYQKKDCIIPMNQFREIYFKDHYDSDAFQNNVEQIRKKYKKEWMYEYKYCIKLLIQDKKKFNKAGFANFEDMNNIALKVLEKNSKASEVLSKKFPVIIIDECQDLSWIEIEILKILSSKGSKLHFVGDLNQSVYEFKRVDPNDTLEFIKDFEKMKLDNNFRSCQEIVDFTSRLIPLHKTIIGEEKTLFQEKSLLFLEYDAPKEAVEAYGRILDKLNIKKSNSCIIVKQNSLKNELVENDKNPHLFIVSLQYWAEGTAVHKQMALKYIGNQIAKWLKDTGMESNYYCPTEINSVFKWRIFLKDILCECINNRSLMNFDRKYSQWYADARKELPDIIGKHFYEIQKYSEKTWDLDKIFSGTWYKASDAKSDIVLSNIKGQKQELEIVTVHASKGCTYDSTLVLSSKGTTSQSGHWKAHWLEGDDEDKRVGYVASTRAKYLLVWGVPKLMQEEKQKLEELGFIDGKSIISVSP